MLSESEIYDLLYGACDNAQPDNLPIVDVPGLGDVDLDTVRKLKWNGITFKKGRKLWRVYDSVVFIGVYSYELAYLINNSDKQAIILEMGEEKE
nr:MAG TPA: hypothetical protein [Caudoviricetes sp.]DAR46866.1 MAG TPA: hypothetical protein [Caudoviricetes sp.]